MCTFHTAISWLLILYFDYYRNMKMNNLSESDTITALAALAQPSRLRAFRALVVAGQQGLTAGALAQQLNVPPSSLSFHLKELAHAGLVDSEQQGRFLLYRARFARMNSLINYLTEHCCEGQTCEVTASTCSDC
jgi:ArsR family transcriptional regulator